MDDRKQELIKAIKDQIPYVDIKPYSHNIIGLKLQMLSTEYGQEESNKLIRETKLKDIGWTVIEEDECDACEGKCKSNETEKCDDCGVELRIGCANNPSDHSIFNDCCDDCRVEEDCNCILRGNNICYNEFNCENCGECLNWKGYEEGTKNCGECRLNLNKDLN